MTTATGHARHLAAAGLIAAATTVTGGAVGEPPNACAEPREWDVANYDDCVVLNGQKYQSGQITLEQYNRAVIDCCVLNGGIWTDSQGCVAPPAEQSAQPTALGMAPRPGEATQNPAPPPPPIRNPEVTPTFVTPGSVGPG